MTRLIRCIIFILTAVTCSPLQAVEILIGSGSTNGHYARLSTAICRIINRNVSDLECRLHETADSISNLGNVQGGSLELGIVRSDQQHHAVTQSGPFEFVDISYDRVRALFSLHVDPFTVVARNDSGIQRLNDLKGRRVNIGNPGSRQRLAMEVVMSAKGWSKQDFQLVTELPLSQHSLALCHDRVQAIVLTEVHPNPSIKKAVALCDAKLVDTSGPVIDALIKDYAYYGHTVIPGSLYDQNGKSIETFGLMATVISSKDVEADLIYEVVKGFFEHLDEYQRLYVQGDLLTPEKMVTRGLSAPLHEGALRYYREKGWIE